MKINNILVATNYLEFINEIDNLVWELLYSPEGGYTLLTAKDAVLEAQKVIQKYDYETSKIAKKTEFQNTQNVIEDKRCELVTQVDKHYQKEALVWADNVYQDLIENCLLCVSINKDNKESIDKLYNRALCAISWIKDVKHLDNEEQNALVEKFNDEFYRILYTDDESNYTNQSPIKSDSTLYLDIINMIIDDEDQFINLDLSKFCHDLNREDISFFNAVKNDLNTYKRTSIKDEILLINSAIEILNLQKNEEKYRFIKQVRDDFMLFLTTNKKFEEKDKINLVKRRISLCQDKMHKNSKYYKNLLTSSSNE